MVAREVSPGGDPPRDTLSARSRVVINARLTILDQAIRAACAGTIDDVQRREALWEAHKLAGSLGMLGFTAGSDLALALERLLTDEPELAGVQASVAADLLFALRQEVDRTGLATPSGGSSGPAKRSARILVADDDDIGASLIEAALRYRGHEVRRARNGAEALQLATTRRFDLVLLDVQMPEMDGFAVCRALRSHDQLLDVPIIMLTARGETASLRRALELGASDYLVKPLAVADLRTLVDLWLTDATGASH
jgi:CheY-like chemotaxis protein